MAYQALTPVEQWMNRELIDHYEGQPRALLAALRVARSGGLTLGEGIRALHAQVIERNVTEKEATDR